MAAVSASRRTPLDVAVVGQQGPHQGFDLILLDAFA
jgi:hypothetical protein